MTTDTPNDITIKANDFAVQLETLATQAKELAIETSATMGGHEASFFLNGLTVFILACFVGYYVVWRVTPALHSPLMGVTNAISSVIIVGALVAAGPMDMSFSKFMGFLAVILASINIFGGFIVTKRMLHMFSKKKA
ncbi:MAG: NAD(P) transhydrogenase subunit alpha [Alphaproteobacteria bacterium]|nr:NAD(P) transhydrogenase subunit alpha [Alphaproteobacteria bacterium]NCQ87479.1 NAD(P) transhydrogenase subunit alpha [Alphaproteobacteria bacterium]NCT06350.1 NAD(P) transhydrogenase subunit alpha [Alphaproteobacteria bacterium]